MTVVFCDPPQPRAWLPVLEEVMARPGEWAMLRPYRSEGQVRDAVRYLRSGRARKPAGCWTFRVGRLPDGEPGMWGLWARCDGES